MHTITMVPVRDVDTTKTAQFQSTFDPASVRYHVHPEDDDSPESGSWFWSKALARRECATLNRDLRAGGRGT